MNLAFVINDIATEQDNYTTIRLGRIAESRGHRVAYVGLEDMIYEPSGTLGAMATVGRGEALEDDSSYLAALQEIEPLRVQLGECDVMMLRFDPADELGHRDWAPAAGLLFAQIAAANGTLVVNDPTHLTDAVNKTYVQRFPESVRLATKITRDPDEIRAFVAARGGAGVLKPLQGSGGHGVFILDGAAPPKNLSQIIEAVTRDGYAIVQEYCPAAVDGDLRLITLNGRPMKVDGTYACLRRRPAPGDGRANISAGGTVEVVEPPPEALAVAEAVAPKLIADGMYFTGLDIVGDVMLEVNVDSPGGLSYVDDLSGVDFTGALLDDLQRKLEQPTASRSSMTNQQFAVY